MPTLRLEVCSFEVKLWEVDVAGDAPGFESKLLTPVHKLRARARGFNLRIQDDIIAT